jgi:hypothetical protein
MDTYDLSGIVKVSLILAFLAALITYAQNTSSQPYSDPWYLPILFVMIWWTFQGKSHVGNYS